MVPDGGRGEMPPPPAMTDELVEVLMELGVETLSQWKKELLDVIRKGEITSASTGGGVQYAKSRGISVQTLLSAVHQAQKRLLAPDVIPTVGQCATVIFTRTIS